MSLADELPLQVSADTLYEAFVAWAAERGLALYPHQEEAAIELFDERNVVLATPTGSGKSMVAIAAHFAALAAGEAHVLHGADQGAHDLLKLNGAHRLRVSDVNVSREYAIPARGAGEWSSCRPATGDPYGDPGLLHRARQKLAVRDRVVLALVCEWRA